MDAVDLVSMVVLDRINDIPEYSIRDGVVSYDGKLFKVVIGAGCDGCHFIDSDMCPLSSSKKCVFATGHIAVLIRGKH
jgi:hypothetical protein